MIPVLCDIQQGQNWKLVNPLSPRTQRNKISPIFETANLKVRLCLDRVWTLQLALFKVGSWGAFHELLNLRALKISKLHKNYIFQCMGKIFCVEFLPLKFHTKYLTHTLKDVFIHNRKYKVGSWNHMGHTGITIIQDFIRQMCVPLENSAYFGDGDGVDSNPVLRRYDDLVLQFVIHVHV